MNRMISAAKRGFTLIEILIVVLILSVLAALVVPAVVSALDDSKVEASEARGHQILTMITRFNEFLPGGAAAISTADGAIAAADLQALVDAGYCATSDLPNQLVVEPAGDSTDWQWEFTGGKVIPSAQ